VDAAGARAAAAAVDEALRAGAGGGAGAPDAAARAATRARARALPLPLALTGGAVVTFDVVLRRAARNAAEPNGACELVVQLGALTPSPREAALALLAAHLVNEPFFDDLRTRQALGYVVQSSLRVDAGVASLRFVVQSTKVSPAEARARIESFLAAFPAAVAALSPEAFASNVAAVATARGEADKSLEGEAQRLWTEVTEPGRLSFARASAEVDALLALSQADAVAFFAERVAPGGARRAAAVALVEPGADAKAAVEGKAGEGKEEGGKEGEGEDGDDEDDDEDGSDGGSDEEGDAAAAAGPPVSDDALAGGGARVLPPGAELEAPLAAVAAALAALTGTARGGEPLDAAAAAAAFAAAGVPHVGDALRAGERVLRIQARCASAAEAADYLALFPDFDALRRAAVVAFNE